MSIPGRMQNFGGVYPNGYGFQPPNYWPQYQQPQPQPVVVQQETNTRMVEIEPAESVRAAQETPVGAGMTKMFIGNDDSFMLVKSVSMTGQVSMVIYDRRPPEPPPATINPEEYVRRDEIAAIIAEAIGGQTKRTAAKKEAAGE